MIRETKESRSDLEKRGECKTGAPETGSGFSAMGVERADESGSSWEKEDPGNQAKH